MSEILSCIYYCLKHFSHIKKYILTTLVPLLISNTSSPAFIYQAVVIFLCVLLGDPASCSTGHLWYIINHKSNEIHLDHGH